MFGRILKNTLKISSIKLQLYLICLTWNWNNCVVTSPFFVFKVVVFFKDRVKE